MGEQQFDELARTLGRGATRRRVLRGLGGALAAAIGLKFKPAAAQQTKQSLCHATGSPDNPWVVISVAEPAWETHFAHGDTPFVDCCVDADCAANQACIAGACSNVFCPTTYLTGAAGGLAPIEIDDDVAVFLNGGEVFRDADGVQGFFGPVALGGVADGDEVRVVAFDTVGFEYAIGPLYLFCVETGATQVLDANGFRICCTQPPLGGASFYDEAFIVDL